MDAFLPQLHDVYAAAPKDALAAGVCVLRIRRRITFLRQHFLVAERVVARSILAQVGVFQTADAYDLDIAGIDSYYVEAGEDEVLVHNCNWGNPSTLQRHFRDHGADFAARSADDYARMADDFFVDAQRRGLPTKIDSDGVIRVYDPSTNTFGAYNPDGTTRTFFKPTSSTYWDRQPGVEPWTG